MPRTVLQHCNEAKKHDNHSKNRFPLHYSKGPAERKEEMLKMDEVIKENGTGEGRYIGKADDFEWTQRAKACDIMEEMQQLNVLLGFMQQAYSSDSCITYEESSSGLAYIYEKQRELLNDFRELMKR